MKIGLTGGIGSGKSLVSQFFRKLQVPVLNSDEIVRHACELCQPAYHEIVDHFGSQILTNDKRIDRLKLRHLAFNSTAERRFLENLLHPIVKTEIEKAAQNLPATEYLVIEIPLLVETNFQKEVDRILVVDCLETEQIKRMKQRDHLSDDIVQAILESQASRKERLQFADDVITNEGSIEDLNQAVLELHQFYHKLVSQKNHNSE